MIPQMIAFDSEEDFNDFLASMAMLGMPCQVEEPKKESKEATFAKLMELSGLLESMGAGYSFCEPEPETSSTKQPLTGGSVNYYTVKVKDQPVECGDIIDALELTFNEANIFKEIWRTANARLGNGKPGNTALRGAEKIAYYANRILEAEKQKA